LGGGGTPLDLSGGKQIQSLGVPVGTVIMWAGQALPPSYLLCDGTTFDAVKYPTLNAALGGNRLPDMRGMFVKGGAAPNFTQQNYKTALPTGGTKFGGYTEKDGVHNHGVGDNIALVTVNTTGHNLDPGTTGAHEGSRNFVNDGFHMHLFQVDRGGDNVTEPKHIVLVYCIKADDIGMSTIN